MQLGCPRCHERQTVPASLLSSGEARVRCGGCGAWFQVRVRSAAVPPPPPSDAAPSGRWSIRRRDETILQFPSIRALYDYVVQGVVTIDDEISRGGKRWRPLRDVPELHGLFDRVEVLPAQPVQDAAHPPPLVDGDGELEPILVAEVVVEPPLARLAAPPPALRPAPAPAAAFPPAPLPARPRSPGLGRWQHKGIEDLGAADGSDEDEDGAVVAPRRSAWGATAVVLLLAGVGAWAVWHFSYRDSGDPIRVRSGELLPPSQRAGGPDPLPAREGGADVQAAVLDLDAAPSVALRSPEEATQQGRGAVEPLPAADLPVARPPEVSHAAKSAAEAPVARPPEPAELGFDAHMRRGNDLMASNPTAAIAHFQKAMGLSGSVEPVAKIGWAYLNQGRPQEAIVWFERAMARSSRYASTYEGLGRALERAGRRSEAIRAYEQYLENFPVGSQASRVRAALERLRGAP